MINTEWRSAKRILTIRLENLGDVLVTTPAIHAIKEAFPHSELTLMTSPVGAQVAQVNTDIDNVIVHKAPWIEHIPDDSEREQQIIATLRERQFDGAFIFTSFRQSARSRTAAYLCYLAGIPLRVAASYHDSGSLLTTYYKPPECIIHEVEHALNLVSTVGITTSERGLILQVPQAARENVRKLLSSYNIDRNTPLIVVHPGCSMPARTYPWEMYVCVIDQLVEQLHATVMITGSKDEQKLIEQIITSLHEKNRHKVFSLAGKLPFPSLCALIETTDITITNNTGPMHISAAVQTPVIALYALTHLPQQWRPWNVRHRLLYQDVPCKICYARICPYQHECLQKVSPKIVIDAVSELLFSSRHDLSNKYH